MTDPFAPFEAKMRGEGIPDVAIESFRRHYRMVREGSAGLIAEADIRPVEGLPEVRDLSGFAESGDRALTRCAVVKLNGGLGTGMGMSRAKSLLPLRGDQTFLDIIAKQVLHLRQSLGAPLPLLLMNSYRTQRDSLVALGRYPALAEQGLPLDFLQHKVPRISADTLGPVAWEKDPTAEWCPPGHGDIYPALVSSGRLQELRDLGIEYLFVSNADNLGAVLDPEILGWFASQDAPLLMEVCRRSAADRKGGHLARASDGGLLLREVAQCPEEDLDAFQDIERHRYFNTNSLWLRVSSLHAALEKHGGYLPLPMIRNRKRVDPAVADSPEVDQLESAMGAAIELFEGSEALCVPRSRFAPVKTTSDLLVVGSDAYHLGEDGRLLPAAEPLPRIDLDPAFYASVDALALRFPSGPPSLRDCRELIVRGDVYFGAGVRCRGRVSLSTEETLRIEDGAELGGN